MSEIEDPWVDDYQYMRNAPTGPLKWIHQFGTYVRTFDDPHIEQLVGTHKETLQYHVPQQFRSKYRPEQLPKEYLPDVVWDVDKDGYVLCTGITLRATKCRKQAVNRSGYCESHGGALHPFDKVRWIGEKEELGIHNQINLRESRDPNYVDTLTRWQQLQMGIITVEDLDDEELARGQCRDGKGGFSGHPPRTVPRELHDQMMKQLLSRAQQKFREGLLGSIEALTSIAQGSAYEPADRIKAATTVIDRVMGKTPDIVLTAETKAPWEQIFDTISRDTDGDAAYKRLEAAIDAEVVEDVPVDVPITYNETERNPGHVEPRTTPYVEPTLDGEPVVPPPLAAGPYIVPPQDPLARQNYERIKAREEAKETKTSLRERIKSGRARRYAARESGLETIENLPYSVETKELVKPTEDTEGLYRVNFVAPENVKVPHAMLTKEGRRRRYDRE